LRWALTANVTANWHPLTLLSHVLDCQLFGLQPWGHHLTNVLLHACNAGLLLLLLWRLTRWLWPSVIVAALFALHPLRVESVAWISERKDVLSTCLGLLAMHTYCAAAANTHRRTTNLALTSVLFALSLLAKPMLVTLPCLLLLLDLWPLQRWSVVNRQPLPRLMLEKLPLFGLSAVFSVITVIAQHTGGAVRDLQALSLGTRIANSLVSYLLYLAQMFWPANLAIPYPMPRDGWPVELIALAAFIVLVLTILAVIAIRRRPWVTVGWFWFVGMLVPVIGLVQVGSQARADRYTYLPMVGLFIAIVWSIAHQVSSLQQPLRRSASVVCIVITTGVLVALSLRTINQLQYWRDSTTLFTHSIAVTVDNAVAHSNLGTALAERRDFVQAQREFAITASLRPGTPSAHLNLGNSLADLGLLDAAIDAYRKALALRPDYADAYMYLGRALAAKAQVPQAIQAYMQALALNPDFAEAHNNLGAALGSQNRLDDARLHFEAAIAINPHYADAHANLGALHLAQSRIDQAIAELTLALQIQPEHADAARCLQAARAARSKS
jgi:Flp pilus assembly protein TadD